MADEKTFFDLPNFPEDFGVVLDSPDLRRLNFSALEYQTMRRAIIEYVKTYWSPQFNDYQPDNGTIMFSELVSYIGGLLSQRSDVLVNESFLPTAQTLTATNQHLFLINNEVQRATPAVVDVEVSIQSAVSTAINIPAGTSFNLLGTDGNPITYEIYRAPGDFSSEITILPGRRGVIAFGIEGRFATPKVVESAGGPFQEIRLLDDNILEEPILMDVQTGNTTKNWTRVDTLERAGPTDEVFEVIFDDVGAIVRSGNDVTGKALLPGQIVTVNYRVGGGSQGRISANALNSNRTFNPEPPASAPIIVTFRNTSPSNGGNDRESIERAKLRAPKESAALQSATSGEDYAIQAKTFNHPVFGSVLKAVATVRTSLNANVVELYVLAAGPDDVPVLPSLGLKQGLETFFEDIGVLTDEVRALDASIKPVDVEAKVIISRNADPSLVKSNVNSVIVDFFDQSNFELGWPFYLSRLYRQLQQVEGVKWVKIFNPQDDILASKKLSKETPNNQVGLDQLLTLGELNLELYLEPSTR